MTLYTGSGNLPFHMDIYADTAFFSKTPSGFVPVRWFGLSSFPGRVWGCHVLLESGAVYRNLPPHALAFRSDPQEKWGHRNAQVWDCYGPQFSLIAYEALADLKCSIIRPDGISGGNGKYLFTAIPMNDAFSRDPIQSKEFMFIEMDNGRLAIGPTNGVIFMDRSFTNGSPPENIKRQTETWSCE